MFHNVMTIVGNLVDDPVLHQLQGGGSVANFRIASTPRYLDRRTQTWVDGDTLFIDCRAWRGLAEHIAATLHRGDRVIAVGNVIQRSYETRSGPRTVYELDCEDVGPSLLSATAEVSRVRASSSRRPVAA